MLFLRRTLLVLALFVLAVGSFQLVFRQGTVDVSRSLVESDFWMRLLGIVALFFGVVLTIAAWKRAVGLALLFLVIGLMALAGGAILLLYPAVFTSVIYATLLNRSHGSRMFVVQFTGLMRITLGLLLLYGIARPPRQPLYTSP